MWKIKDPELKRKMNQFISDEDINQLCKKQMKGISKCIFFFEDSGVSIRIDKSFFEEFPEYNPDGWNPYPEVKPPRRGYYLVTRLRTRDNGDTYKGVDLCLFGLNNSDIFANSNILAFRELPEPYDPMPWEEDDDSEPEEGD